jgi:hypothetical protein
MTVTCADPVRAGLALETAVTVTVAGVGTCAGAVYTPEVEIVPALALPPVTPLTCQLTAVFGVFNTEAAKACVALVTTLVTLGLTLTLIFAIVTLAEPERVGSAAATALTLTVAGLGIAAGEVYRPVLDIVPTLVLPPVMLLGLQAGQNAARTPQRELIACRQFDHRLRVSVDRAARTGRRDRRLAGQRAGLRVGRGASAELDDDAMYRQARRSRGERVRRGGGSRRGRGGMRHHGQAQQRRPRQPTYP